MPKIIRINMSDLSVRTEETPAEWAGLGGRGSGLGAGLGRSHRPV